MFNLDINLLKERYLEEKAQLPRQKAMAVAAPAWEKQLPLLVGGAVMLLLPLLAVLGTWVINLQAEKTQESIQLLNQEISRLRLKNKSLQDMRAEIKNIDGEIQTLVSVFNYIKPWSAILSDIQSRTPPQVQITNIQQAKQEVKKSSSSSKTEPAPAELPSRELKIQGYARTFGDVNDFLLALQGSKFLLAKATAIETTKLVDLPIKWQGIEGKDASKTVKFPQVVEYSITTQLTEVPVSQLMAELKSQGADGLVARLSTLKQRGVIKP